MNSSSTELVLANAAASLAVASDFCEVKHVRDVAESIRAMSQKVGHTLKQQNKAAAIKLQAERLLGQMLSSIKLGQGKRSDLVADGDQVRDDRTTLKDLGINKSQSSRWQTIASISEEDFNRYIRETNRAKKELTTSGMLRFAKSLQRTVIEVPEHVADPLPAGSFSSFEEAIASSSLQAFSCVYVNPDGIVRQMMEVGGDDDASIVDAFDTLSQLPMKEITSSNAHLHLWISDAQLNDACWLLTRWDFRLASSFVWIKPTLGPGPYWRSSHEIMLTAVRGELPFKHHALRSWQEFAPSVDGQKPDGIRRLIEIASPGPYLELFGNRAIPGWVVVGDPLCLPQASDIREEALT